MADPDRVDRVRARAIRYWAEAVEEEEQAVLGSCDHLSDLDKILARLNILGFMAMAYRASSEVSREDNDP